MMLFALQNVDDIVDDILIVWSKQYIFNPSACY